AWEREEPAMIDKVPQSTETTTLQCQLPRELVARLTEIARQRSLTLEEALGQAIDQSCERWELEEVFGPAEVHYSAPNIPITNWTPIEAKPGAEQRPNREISGPIEDSTISPPMTPAHPEGRPVSPI